jgi:phosphopantetheinyl transferase
MQEKNGRIRIRDRPDIFISLSYSGSCIAVTAGRRKIGSDIERVRPMNIMKSRSSPILDSLTSGHGKEYNQHLLHVWTLLEAYAKFHDMSLYPLTQDRFFLPDAHFVSYLIDQRSILSLASDSRPIKDTLLWIDPGCGLVPCGGENTATGSSPHMDGDAYVRT